MSQSLAPPGIQRLGNVLEFSPVMKVTAVQNAHPQLTRGCLVLGCQVQREQRPSPGLQYPRHGHQRPRVLSSNLGWEQQGGGGEANLATSFKVRMGAAFREQT